MKATAAIRDEAERIAGHLEAVRRVMQEAVWDEARRFPVPLTPQQVLALRTLVDQTRNSTRSLSLSELTEAMGLAHSTVSGIVARLEARNLLVRRSDPIDRRVTRIELAQSVKDWLAKDLPTRRTSPLTLALSEASPAERQRVLDGLATLERLVSRNRGNAETRSGRR